MRREGLYQSHVEKWRRARERGALNAASTGRNVTSSSGGSGRGVLSENRTLKAENDRLAAELATTRAVLEVVGKAHALLELFSLSAVNEPSSRT